MSNNRLHKTLWISLVTVLALALVTGAAFAKGKPPKDKPAPPIFLSHPQQDPQSGPAQPVTPGGRPLYATLSGAAEIPGPGDPDGSGTAKLRLNQGQGTICFEITVTGITPPTAAHIHSAMAGSSGPVVVSLSAPVNGTAVGCASASKDLIKAIRQSPANYYVNVHTSDFPAGALRGQLSK
jgi:hypothetical protein